MEKGEWKMMPFTRTELKHLKWKLMNHEGLSEAKANEHIRNLIEEVKSNHAKAKEKSKEEAPVSFKDSFQALLKRRR